MPDSVARSVMREVTPLSADEPVGEAVRKVVGAGLPALPAVEADGSFAGVFGAREFISAFFPAYVAELGSSAMISRTVDDVIERRRDCVLEAIGPYLTTDHVVIEGDFSDTRLAELFLHHQVQIIPIASQGRIHSVVSIDDFLRALTERLEPTADEGAES